MISLGEVTFEFGHHMPNILLHLHFLVQLNPFSRTIGLLGLLHLASGLGLGWAQTLNLGWQGLPTSYTEARRWDLVGQDQKGFWLRLNGKKEQKLEYRNLRMELQQAVTLPDYLHQTDKATVLNTDSGMHLLFDLFNPTAKEHGLFVSKIPKDSNRLEPGQLILETLDNQSDDLLDFEILKDSNGTNGWIIHRRNSMNQLTFQLSKLDTQDNLNPPIRLILDAQTLGLDHKIVFTKCHRYHKTQNHHLIFLFQYRTNQRDRKGSLWGMGVIDLKKRKIIASPLKTSELGEQILFVRTPVDQDSVFVHGYLLEDRFQWPYATVGYRMKLPLLEDSLLPISSYTIFEQDFGRRLLNLKGNEGNLNRIDDPYACLLLHQNQSATLCWRRRFRSSETIVQYSQGMPMYREIIRYHANEWIITHLRPDGSHAWSQILPMNLIANDRNQVLDTYGFTVGQAMLIVGYQNLNNKTVPFILQILGDGNIINPDLDHRLKGQIPNWSNSFVVDLNNTVVPSRLNGRAGLLYLHFPKP
jgi:hypothetical protein